MPKNSNHCPILVGIGSSAGGLKALQCLVENLIPDGRKCYVIAQHLSPNHKSKMVELIAKHTEMSVVSTSHGSALAADTIYICPENNNITIKDQCLCHSPPVSDQVAIPNINQLFSSIAEEYQHNSIAIVLSGVGSDGAEGVKLIKSNGGKVIVQSSDDAQYDGMLKAACNAVKADFILNAEQIGPTL